MKKRFAKGYLEITNVCNLACSFCHGTKRQARFLTVDEFVVLAGKLRPETDYLYLHVMGEPLLHPGLGEILTESAQMGFFTCLTTNGTLLGQKRELLTAHAQNIRKMSISLHSAEANGQVLRGYLDTAVDVAAEMGARGTITVLRLWNLGVGGKAEKNGEILELLHRKFPGEWTDNRGGPKIGEGVYLEWGEKFDWPDRSADDHGEVGYCYGLRDHVAVLCDGSVVPCCLDSDGEMTLGNLFTQDLEEILASPRAAAIRDGFAVHRAVEPLCRRCGFARRFL